MKNLHHFRIYYNSPQLLKAFESVGLEVDPKRDEMASRRFIMGERHTEMKDPVRSKVQREADVLLDDSVYSSFSQLIAGTASHYQVFLKDKGIAEEDIVSCDLAPNPERHDGVDLHITYKAMESDAEFASRQRYARIFNTMLAHRDEIYALLDYSNAVAAS